MSNQRVFNKHTDAYERLVIYGKYPQDHIQRSDFDYSTELKNHLRKLDQDENEKIRTVQNLQNKVAALEGNKVDSPRKRSQLLDDL